MKKQLYLVLILAAIGIMNGFGQVNYDEKEVPKFILPKMLTSEKGVEIATSEQWNTLRRPEILELFKTEVYGFIEDEALSVEFEVLGNDQITLNNKAIRKNVLMHFIKGQDTVSAHLLIYIPSKKVAHPVPIFLGLNFYGNHTVHYDTDIPITDSYIRSKIEYNVFENQATEASRGVRSSRWPIEPIIDRGYGIATIYYGDLDPDFDDNFENGIHQLLDKPADDTNDSRSAISAWAYGLSSAMDYFDVEVKGLLVERKQNKKTK